MVNRVWNNVELTLASAGDEVTFRKSDGNDSATDIYFNFQDDSIIKSIVIVPDKNILLVSINGETAKVARTIIGDKGFIIGGDAWLQNWNNFKIRAVSATTDVKVTVFLGIGS